MHGVGREHNANGGEQEEHAGCLDRCGTVVGVSTVPLAMCARTGCGLPLARRLWVCRVVTRDGVAGQDCGSRQYFCSAKCFQDVHYVLSGADHE
jgi:hypothetical protein